MTARALSLVGGSLCCVTLLTGCHASASIGGKSISKSDIEQKAATALAAQAHQPAPTVTCPSDLDAKVGATEVCTLTPQGSTEKDPVTVKVTSVSGDSYHLDFSVGAPAS
jgi:hypothetical protein